MSNAKRGAVCCSAWLGVISKPSLIQHHSAMSAGSNLVIASLASSHALAAGVATRRTKPTVALQGTTAALRAKCAKACIELGVAGWTIWCARSRKNNEEPRANTRNPEIHEQVLRQGHAENDAGEKRSHAEHRDARTPVIMLCNRPELLSKGRHIFGAIVRDDARWRCRRLPQI